MKICSVNSYAANNKSFTTNNQKPNYEIINFKAQNDSFVSKDTLSLNDMPEQRSLRITKTASKALNKAQTAKQEAQAIKEQENEITQKANAELKKVQKKQRIIEGEIQAGEDNNYESFKKDGNRYEFEKAEKFSIRMTMYEYDDASSKLIRKTEFDTISKTPLVVEEYRKKEGTNRYEFASFADNFVLRISKGIKETTNSKSVKKEYSYGADGTLKRFVKDKNISQNGTESSKEHFFFTKGELSYYAQNQTQNPKVQSSSDKEFSWNDGKLVTYKENIKRTADGRYQSGEEFNFKNEQLAHYKKVRPVNNKENNDEHFDFEQGVLYRYYNENEVVNF